MSDLYRVDADQLNIGLLVESGALVPVTEPLLTRDEAANDEHVQRMVWAQLTGGALPTGGDRR